MKTIAIGAGTFALGLLALLATADPVTMRPLLIDVGGTWLLLAGLLLVLVGLAGAWLGRRE